MAGKGTFVKPFHGLRGIASLMVFVTHILNGYSTHVSEIFSAKTLQMISDIGAFGVEIFFFLSGFVIFKTSLGSDSQTFFQHRFWRIYPVFLLFTLFYFFANAALQIAPDKNNLYYLFSNLLFLDIFLGTPALTPNAWSITYEIWYYFITFYLVTAWTSHKLDIKALVALSLLAYFVVWHPITIYFVLGVGLALSGGVEKKLQRRWLLPVQFGVIVLVVYLNGVGTEFGARGWTGIIHNLPEVLLPAALFLFMATLLQSTGLIADLLSNRLCMFFGTISYSLYLLHPYSYLASRMIVEKYLPASEGFDVGFVVFLLLVTALTISASWLLNVWVENRIYKKMTKKEIYRK